MSCLYLSLALYPALVRGEVAEIGSPAEAMAECASLENAAARLECYDELARGLAPAVPPVSDKALEEPAEAPAGEELTELAGTLGAEVVRGWLVHEEIDPLDGTRGLIAMRPAEPPGDGGSGAEGRAQLLIGCVQVRRTSKEIREDPAAGDHRFVARLGIGWSEYLGSDTRTPVNLSLDGGAPEVLSMYADGQSVVISGPTAADWVGRLLQAERLVVDVQPHDDSARISARFELSGLERVIEPAGGACGW